MFHLARLGDVHGMMHGSFSVQIQYMYALVVHTDHPRSLASALLQERTCGHAEPYKARVSHLESLVLLQFTPPHVART